MYKIKKYTKKLNLRLLTVLGCSLVLLSGCATTSTDDLMEGATLSGKKEEMLNLTGYDNENASMNQNLYKTVPAEESLFKKAVNQVCQRRYLRKDTVGVEDKEAEVFLLENYVSKDDLVLKGEKMARYQIKGEDVSKDLLAPYDGYVISISRPGTEETVNDPTTLFSFAPLEYCMLSINDLGQNFRYMQKVDINGNIGGQEVTKQGQVISLSKKQIKLVSAFAAGVDYSMLSYSGMDHTDKINFQLAKEDQELYKSSSYTVNANLVEIDGVILLSKSLIHTEGEINYVYILQDGQILKQNVLLGPSNSSSYCVIDGLTEDMTVVEY